MWVGSNGDGLFRVDGRGSIERFGVAEGLTNGFVWQVLEDRDGRVWCYTNQGIFPRVLVRRRTAELEESRHLLEQASLTDPLTGLMNRRYLDSRIQEDLAQTRRAYHAPRTYPNQDIVFMLIDLDDFKAVNDNYGHAAEDRVLRQYGELIRAQLRETDYVVRWGGEEFLVVVRQTEARACYAVAERILEAARGHRFPIDDASQTISCLCSLGVSRFPFVPGRADALGWEWVIEVADAAIYMAKRRGRDGWVAIHGAEGATITEADAFVRWLKQEPRTLIERGDIVVESSFGNAPPGPPPGPD